MTGTPFDAWGADAPPDGFADRATAAVLRDRGAARPRGARAWVALAAAAFVGVAGGAWAWTAGPRPVSSEASPVDPRVERADPTSRAAPRAFPEPVVEPPAPTLPRPRASALPAHPPVAAPSAPLPKVPRPLCRCTAFACDCGPE